MAPQNSCLYKFGMLEAVSAAVIENAGEFVMRFPENIVGPSNSTLYPIASRTESLIWMISPLPLPESRKSLK